MVDTVADLIAALQKMPQDAKVRTRPENAKSRRPYPSLGEGYQSSWLYDLSEQYAGFKEAKSRGKTYPVVWI
ncbi:hypothetical protein HWB60_gp041 [Mycobacterium phage TChen]|uniref:Uncharacterized protein n=1 Tax=Mycobacterium phage TChen TaxID=2163598 RepID=A0A2S1PD00_9CAUD|nr:hypothetical protein HWB60_gp041 [Mycobacterium phage TChen]AWH14441.1 hypothetical protein SEA_TCHEN_41 [Mycobacterium phage TChen]